MHFSSRVLGLCAATAAWLSCVSHTLSAGNPALEELVPPLPATAPTPEPGKIVITRESFSHLNQVAQVHAAQAWLLQQWSQAIDAHRRGEHHRVLEILEPLSQLRGKMEEQAVKLGLKKAAPGTYGDEGTFDLSVLDQVPDLTADTRRRIAENITERPEINDPEAIPGQSKRIALLIRDLEEVNADRFMSPGPIAFPMDPVVRALVAEGEEAVDPLITALESDRRLTKTVDVGWMGRGTRPRVVGVEEPIRAALVGILRSRDQIPNLDLPYFDFQPNPPRLKPTELARAIRAYWNHNRGKPMPERWYGVLADDTATPAAWAEAAENLTGRQSHPVPVYGEFSFPELLEPGSPDPMRGETLRQRTGPSLTELIARRLRDAWEIGSKSSEAFALNPAYSLGDSLARWDGKHALPALRTYSQSLRQSIAEQNGRWDFDGAAELIRLYAARHELGDAEALRDYAEWITSLDAKRFSRMAEVFIFAPLWLYPTEPAIADVAKRLFIEPDSPWRSETDGMNPAWVSRAAASPLVSVPEFRTFLLEQLRNPLIVGGAELFPGGRTAYFFPYLTPSDYGGAESLNAPKHDVRLGDKIAGRIARVRGAPEFSTTWPKDKRDAAISKIADFITRFGDRFMPYRERVLSDPSPAAWDHATDATAEIQMPALDRPARAADVRAGRAIFSQDDGSDRKIWPLPEIPRQTPPGPRRLTKARWITLQDFPEPGKNADGSQRFDQEVDVWQAEDAVIEGTWARTFGVVAKHRVAAVPAGDIVFDFSFNDDGWHPFVQISANPGNPGQHNWVEHGKSVEATVNVKNLRGIPQQLNLSSQQTGPIDPQKLGVEIRMSYSAGPAKVFKTFGADPGWKPLAPNPGATVDVQPVPDKIETLAEATLLTFDAAKMFDLNTPGFYRLELVFKKGGLFSGEKLTGSAHFEVTK